MRRIVLVSFAACLWTATMRTMAPRSVSSRLRVMADPLTASTNARLRLYFYHLDASSWSTELVTNPDSRARFGLHLDAAGLTTV